MTTKLKPFMALIVLFLSPVNDLYAKSCIRIFIQDSINDMASKYRFNESTINREREEVSFTSAKKSNGFLNRVSSTYELGYSLSQYKSVSQIFITPDKKYIVKIYPSQSKFPIHEVLVTEYLISQGLDVPKIIDYSSNVFSTFGTQVIVKEYKHGLNIHERDYLGVPKDSELADLLKLHDHIMRGFVDWLSHNSKHLDRYLRYFNRSNYPLYGDHSKLDNWLLTDKGWKLIDP